MKFFMKKNSGQAALIAVLFFLFISLVVLGTFAAIGASKLASSNELLISRKAYATSESAIEDAIYRIGKSSIPDHMLGDPAGYDVPLNSGNAHVLLTDADGNYSTADYIVSVRGQVAERYRNAEATFTIGGEGEFSVSVENPVQAGYLGISMGNNAIIRSNAGSGLGGAFSNGSVVAISGTPQIDGSVSVAKSIGNSPWITHNTDITSQTATTYTIGKDTNRIDAAQSFVPNITADILKIKVFIKPIGGINASLPIKIYANRRIHSDGSSCDSSNADCYDMPAVSGIVNSGNISTSDLDFSNGGTYKWVTVDLNYAGAKPLIMNEKYWVVFDTPCTSGGCLSGTAGWALGGVDGNYDADSEYYAVPDAYQDKVRMTGPSPTFLQIDNINNVALPSTSNCYIDVPVLSPICASSKEIAFQIYLGSTQTVIDGSAAGGKLSINGDARAEKLNGIDVTGIAYYTALSTPTITDEVIAGRSLTTPTTKTYDCTNAQSTPCVDGADANTYACRTKFSTSAPQIGVAGDYCGCKYTNGSSDGDFCQVIASAPDTKPQRPFGFAKYIELLKKTSSLSTTTGDIILTASNAQRTSGIATTTIPGSDFFRSVFYLGGVINGNLTIKNYAGLELSGRHYDLAESEISYPYKTCPFNESSGESGKPCYVLRVTGNLTIQDHAQLSGKCYSPCSVDDKDYSLYVLVDGNISVTDQAKIYGFNHPSGSSGVFLVSYAKDITPPYAVSLKSTTAGSIYYAFRGAVSITDNIGAKAIAGQKVILTDNADVNFDEGLINPFSEDGGTQSAGLSISDFRETE